MSKMNSTIDFDLKTILKMGVILLAAVVASGCITAKSKPVETAEIAEPAVAPVEEPVVEPVVETPIVVDVPEVPDLPQVIDVPEVVDVPEVPEVVEVPEEPAEPEVEVLTSWIVSKGEHLWGIAGVEEVYNASEQWPLLYKANLGQIRDADLIYPGQVLDIPRDSSEDAIGAAVRHARNRGAWAVGPVEESDEQYLSTSP